MQALKIGINGFGRVGRAIARIVSASTDIELVAVNDIDSDIENFAYLLKYDSLYGRCRSSVSVDVKSRRLRIDNRSVAFHSERCVTDVPWRSFGVDVVIESSGVLANADLARGLVMSECRKVVVTNAFPRADTTIIVGVNERAYDPDAHHVVSSSICDANAIVPALHYVNVRWGIEAAHVTTLHPWLSYQNLLDGPVSSISSPGHTWRDYGLGRASVLNLIPKDTTAAHATLAVLPELQGRLGAISFRVPTHVVSASDITVHLKRPATATEVNEYFDGIAAEYPRVVAVERDQLVSSDYIGTPQSCIVAARQTRVVGGTLLKLLTWYDNEWGYASRVVDVAKLVHTG